MVIFLIGYMGSGKTKTAELLARKLNFEFIDTDRLIESEQKQSVSEIFSSKGEPFFRRLEKQTLRSLDNKKDIVVATGGGLPCFDENMDLMNRAGLTVYLQVPVGMLIQRLSQAKGDRPLIAGLSKEELELKVKSQLQEREAYYLKAKIIFEVSKHSTDVLFKQILHLPN